MPSCHDNCWKDKRCYAHQRGALHIIAAIFTAILLIGTLIGIRLWAKRLHERAENEKKVIAAEPQPPASPASPILDQIDAEQFRIQTILGAQLSKEEMLTRIEKLSFEAKEDARKRIALVLDQPESSTIEHLIDVAFSRWETKRQLADLHR